MIELIKTVTINYRKISSENLESETLCLRLLRLLDGCEASNTLNSLLNITMLQTAFPNKNKKSETELTASVLKKKNIKNIQELKKNVFYFGQDKTKCANFRGSPFSKLRQNKNKQTTNLLLF